jgi:hypothetical protein
MTVQQQAVPEDLGSGQAAVTGHRILGAVSVVCGALETLACNESLSAANRLSLHEAIARNLDLITEAATTLSHGGRP